ncbi:putative aromatic acid decarboxylase [Clostridium homopropionicum DSM 5847]|uniref:Flavin prenyltransferase UbiX n=1 Tax=Clostridium homopropionicum DSM 5847 TaxID=1121318 RepID=A0A0L6Z550_9CLOT|nr:flavin prenyltransferase UbiX [Clostridium homopropionicum]KOA18094.1 putative aromatic acid decarboxylase [Clostridium homopropionicum DSM 5847]SFG71758.1 4-hydroxy-3-polyprenylbenzoate decarboxylase [Clostridium homopropionicum]
MKSIIIGITGASGSIYAIRLIEELLKNNINIYVICTETGRKVVKFETGTDIDEWIGNLSKASNNIHLEDINNLFSSVASGSFKFDSMIILPCSMGTLAEISNGLAKNLLCRAADVALKENRRLIIVPRETPFNAIHLENMLKLSRLGVTILPAMPGFYHKPKTIEDLINFVVGKILDSLSIENTLFKKWGD